MKSFFKALAFILGILSCIFGLLLLIVPDVAFAVAFLLIGVVLILIGKKKKADPSVKIGPSSGIDPEKRTNPVIARPLQEEKPSNDPEFKEWEIPEKDETTETRPEEYFPAQREVIRTVYVQQAAPEMVENKKPWWENLPKSEAQLRKERIIENRKAGIACCPKCGSTSLSVNKKGYSFVKGVLIGPLGGTIGMNKLKVTCLNCGNIFKPGQK